jgi:hypothetical protein
MDIAARNCLLNANNVVQLADFGLTHAYDEGKPFYRQVGVMKLSVRWLAIDSFESKIFSEASDVRLCLSNCALLTCAGVVVRRDPVGDPDTR